ncbi:MAG: EF-Tu/IF-2/RF-3 family GTPase [bacterium]|nr:EF-Tu/IF-2/RF-3 family GTPase [bacterium]
MPEQGKYIGKIVHYFSNLGVAVIKVEEGELKIGDKIRIVGGQETNFEQNIESMQVDRKDVSEAKAGDEVGMKVSQKVRDEYRVYKIV